ncbi:hypothetical protein HaLaN_32910, partial [Haematococcus lacustris]
PGGCQWSSPYTVQQPCVLSRPCTLRLAINVYMANPPSTQSRSARQSSMPRFQLPAEPGAQPEGVPQGRFSPVPGQTIVPDDLAELQHRVAQ